MGLVPDDKGGRIGFFESHLGKWAENADELGFSPAQIAEMEALTQSARAALREQGMAQNAAMAATNKLRLALDAMMTAGALMIRQVRTRAAAEGEGMYSLANIDPPAKPSPIGAPGKPDNFKVSLNVIGAITLRWTCKNPRGAVGTTYHVWRRIGPSGPFTCLGATGVKKFVDETLPQGLAQVTYQIQAVRSTKAGPWARFDVNFGTGDRRVSWMALSTPPMTPLAAA